MDYRSIVAPPERTTVQPRTRTAARNWLDLPSDLTSIIISKLCAFDILTGAQHVCRQWRSLCMDPCIWRTIYMCNIRISHSAADYRRLEAMCHHAIDRSRGQLVDISVRGIDSYDLLKYIIDSGCDQLRRLQLFDCCYKNPDNGLCGMAQKLPLLEELNITIFSGVFSTDLEAIGQGCPLLKSFKLNHNDNIVFRYRHDCNEKAFAIAQNMPNLRHLQLVANHLNNIGVSAILDGCHCLLDLRLCRNVDLKGELRRRCYEQLKYFVEPDTRYCFRGHQFGYLCCETACYDLTFEYRSGKKMLRHFTWKETQSDSESSNNSCVEFEEEEEEEDWEETYAI